MVENMKKLSDAEIDMFVNYIGALAHGDDPAQRGRSEAGALAKQQTIR